VFFHVMMRRYATREVVHVNFKTKTAAHGPGPFGNHWPSRSGGQFESPYNGPSPAKRSATSTNPSSSCTERRLQWVQPATSFDRPEHLVRPPPEGNGVLFVEQVLDVHRTSAVAREQPVRDCLKLPRQIPLRRRPALAPAPAPAPSRPSASRQTLPDGVVSSWCLRATHAQLGLGPGPPVGRRHRGNGDPDRWHALQAAESGRTRDRQVRSSLCCSARTSCPATG
jgi:hypothetical protein